MDMGTAERHNEFVRNDASAVAILLIIAGIVTSIMYDFTFILGFLSFAFMVVGFSVSWEWRKELAKEDVVEAEPFQATLMGTLFILAMQTGFGYFAFELTFIPALLYGIMSGSAYAFLVFTLCFYDLPGEGYKTRYHPQESNGKTYVFEEYYYIDLVEQEALKRSSQSSPSETSQTTEDSTTTNTD